MWYGVVVVAAVVCVCMCVHSFSGPLYNSESRGGGEYSEMCP